MCDLMKEIEKNVKEIYACVTQWKKYMLPHENKVLYVWHKELVENIWEKGD